MTPVTIPTTIPTTAIPIPGNSAVNNSKKKKKHSSHGNSSEETTAQAAAESSAVADISAVPATGDMAQTGQWVLLGAASLAAIGISLETRRKKKK